MSREDQKQQRRQRIMEAALDLFIRKGYGGTKINDIAKEVGMSAGLMFHYFDSKEKLFEDLITNGVGGTSGEAGTPIDNSSPIRFFESTTDQLLGYIKNSPYMAKLFVLMNQSHLTDAAPDSVKEMLSQMNFYTGSVPMIKAGQLNGTIRQGDPLALSVAFWSAIQGVASTLAMQPDVPCPRGEWIVDIIRKKSDIPFDRIFENGLADEA